MQLRWLLFYLCIIGNSNIHGLLHSKKPVVLNTTETRAQANVKIFSNMAEVLINFGKLPIEFSAEDWSDIRSDSITLVGSNVTIKQQTITEKQKSLDNTDIYIRSPASTASKTEFIKATMIDEKQNIVKITDKDIAKEPVYHRIQSGDIFYTDHPPETKHYINFDYDATGEVFLSYIRSNLKWNTRYQLNLFEETKTPVLIAMADIHNNGHSKIDIQHAELIAGDINLSSSGGGYGYAYPGLSGPQMAYMSPASARYDAAPPPSPKLSRGEELSGLYVFSINQPFSIEGRTNYLLPMFRPRITVDRFSSISKTFYGAVTSSSGKAQRSYRLKAEQFLSRGNCLVRELDRLAGETSIPNLAAKDKHEFSLGEDVDVTYKENSTLISSRNDTNRPSSMISSRDRDNVARTVSTYEIQVAVRNFRKSRGVNVEYNQQIYGHAVKLYTPNTHFSQDGSTIKAVMTIPADDEKVFSYKVEITN